MPFSQVGFCIEAFGDDYGACLLVVYNLVNDNSDSPWLSIKILFLTNWLSPLISDFALVSIFYGGSFSFFSGTYSNCKFIHIFKGSFFSRLPTLLFASCNCFLILSYSITAGGMWVLRQSARSARLLA
jgi:hypothetical protein